MNSLRQKVLAAFSAGAMLLSVVTPAAAQTTLQISGNGSDSDSTIDLTHTATTTVVQNNSADIHNDVSAKANTGNNDANRNTGGDVTVDTGNAKTDVAVSNSVNSNVAKVDCCATGDTSVLISGNGTKSDNDVVLNQDSKVAVYQDNKADIKNDIDAKSDTGKNDANRNTGGTVSVFTGDATTKVDVNNTANANWAKVGGDPKSGSGLVDVRILGNGSDSDNDVDLTLTHATVLTQDNSARIKNDIDANSNTGKNDANRNTGGDVLIDTGNANTDVKVDNQVNFNWADVDCGCLLDILGKIAGNGDKSQNDIKASLGDTLSVFQDNCGDKNEPWALDLIFHRKGCRLNNDVDANAGSGKNDANKNTGIPQGGDPLSVITGNADAKTDISNSGNSNAYGVDPSIEWPAFDFNFNLSLSLSDLLALLGHH